jgi:predicted lipoprotein with Yx(FWY)xxD motif
LTTANPVAGPGIESVKLSTFKRRDGSTQATYDGWPLYTYTREGPEESQGAGMLSRGGTWYALAGAKAVSIEG